ncbi:hypothetical protein [Allocoleopsis franciscana]|uniref:Uncharacterized protein n=1 Tax=Allocoleopsis franciscana PCC 7113 TaxID=1173027 RepID=K9WK21_9CYAN|nr:hypothetical protein [Allocoleopsis franciscana]AFZ20765.1 hypothetical protein Mic7113_5108 [Allocoleopsis franciscana PCC 7113]
MPNRRFRLEVRQQLLVDAGLLALLALMIIIITTAYISSEHNFHWWIDWYARTLDIVTTGRESPGEAIQRVQQSLIAERNRLFTLPLIPFILVFGSSRLVYEIALALVYLLPFALVMGAIATQLIRAHSRPVFWATAFLTLLIPVSWIPTFMGIPDTGGAVFLGLATFFYLQDVRLKTGWRIPLIGFLIGAAILLRRPFVYAGVTFLGAITLQALLFFIAEVGKASLQEVNEKQVLSLRESLNPIVQPWRWLRSRVGRRESLNYRLASVSTYLAAFAPWLWREPTTTGGHNTHAMAWRNLLLAGVRIALIGATVLATLWIVAPQFTYAALTTNYKNLYTSWSLPFSDIFNLYASFYGWGTWLLVLLGFSASLLTRSLPLTGVSLVGLSGVLSLSVWLVVLRYGNVFYSLQVTPFIVIGLVALIWTTWIRLRGKRRSLLLGVMGGYLVVNFMVGLAPIGTMSRVFHPLFALNMPPLVRTDYDEVVRLVNSLRQLTPEGEPILVVGFQRLQLTGNMLRSAEYLLYPEEDRVLNTLPAPEVDSRDSYPLEEMVEAQYVVVPSRLPAYSSNPAQNPAVGEWLPNQENDVVNVVFDAFTQNWEFAQDFRRLPTEFQFENGVVVNIYQRLRPTSLATAVRTLHAMQQQIGERPGSQGNWIILSQWLHNTTVRQNSGNRYKVVAFRRDYPWGEEERTYRLFESTSLVKALGLPSPSGRRAKTLSSSALSVERSPNGRDRTVRGTLASNVATSQERGGTLEAPDSSSFPLPKLRLVRALRNQGLEQPNTALPDQEAREDRTQQLGTSLLYLGPLTDQAKVSGVIDYLDQACVGSSLRVAMLDKEGDIVSSTESAYRHTPEKSTKFDLSVRGQDSAYLLLNILNYDQNDLVNSCTLQINPLTVFNPKS